MFFSKLTKNMKIQRALQAFLVGAGLAVFSGAMLPNPAAAESYFRINGEKYWIMDSMALMVNPRMGGTPKITYPTKSADGRYEFISEDTAPTEYMYTGMMTAYRPIKVRDTKEGKEMRVYVPVILE